MLSSLIKLQMQAADTGVAHLSKNKSYSRIATAHALKCFDLQEIQLEQRANGVIKFFELFRKF